MTEDAKHLKTRFISDMNLPISVIAEPYFGNSLAILEIEYGAKTKYNELWDVIIDRFNASPQKFLEYYHQVRDNIITSVINSDAYKEFLEDKELLKDIKPIVGNRNLYTQEQDGCLFISYDMKKANFQALKYYNPSIVYDSETYEDFIGHFTDLQYIKESKYTRQVIFGKMNPKRTMTLEKQITNSLAKTLVDNYKSQNLEPFSLNADEIIFKFNGNEEDFEKIGGEDITFEGVKYKFSKFKLHSRLFKRCDSETILDVYQKEDYLNHHRRILKGAPSTYFNQIYKLLHGIKITPLDLVFLL